uniref:Ribosomal protein eL8/eL30/eS12/Gadd45 domain-containing protein n=1 Tax=Xiphophorus couchianus TaxID=32473 RepID=A0A3B5LD76_9TELE
TLFETLNPSTSRGPMKSPGKSLKEALVCAQSEHRLTVGVYESAKIMTEDPDNVSFCVLATDEQFEWDVALQIHFTLIQSFCFDNDISIVRVSDTQRLAAIVGDEQEDAHCVLITVRAGHTSSCGFLLTLLGYRRMDKWMKKVRKSTQK